VPVVIVRGRIFLVRKSLMMLLLVPFFAWTGPCAGWESLPGLPTPRFLGPQVSAVDDKIYVVGGMLRDGKTYTETGKVQVFNPSTGTWAESAPMPSARCNFAVTAANGKIFAIGGNRVTNSEVLNIVEEYDPATDRWTRRADMPTGRWHLAVGAAKNQIYAVGGRGGNRAFERYDVEKDAWTRLPDLAAPKENPFCAVLGDRLFVLGGTGPDGKEDYAVFEEYEPDAACWLPRPALPTPRTDVAIVAASGRLFVIGGWQQGGLTAKVEIFNPATNSWTSGSDCPTPVSFAGAAAVGERIFLAGGAKYLEDGSLAPISLMQAYAP